MTPSQIVAELNKHVIGQNRAKRAVAVALRNRTRRQKLSPEMAEEIQPKNILMIGPTGVGKTELARRLARLANAPFLKVEASKFTEVGYVGRDVDSIIRDLVEISIEMVRQAKVAEVAEKAERNAEERLLDLLLPPVEDGKSEEEKSGSSTNGRQGKKKTAASSGSKNQLSKTRAKLQRQLQAGKLNDRTVEIEYLDRSFPTFEIITNQALEEMDISLRELLPGLLGSKKHKRKMKVDEALEYLITEEESNLIDVDQVAREAVSRVEETGIVFLDEIDKIAGRETGHGPEVSREGVQRDILPIIEGTNVSTRYGMVSTDHILFLSAGAFHVSKPSDLIPELQGRFPVRVEMDRMSEEDFIRILEEPRNALTKQYQALLKTEGINLRFRKDGIREIARLAAVVNENAENIGARRLQTILEALLEEISFQGPDLENKSVVIDARYVRDQLEGIANDQDLSRYIL